MEIIKRIGTPVCLLIPIGTPEGCPTSDVVNGNTVPIDLLSNVCVFFILSSIKGKFDLNASSCIPQALFIPTNDLDISVDNSFVNLSKSSKLYANRVDIIEASYSLLYPAAISSLNCSASNLFLS